MSSVADKYYDALPNNILISDLISRSRFDEYLYDKKNIKTHFIPELGLTIQYMSKVSREIANASFVERFKINNDNDYYNLSTFNEKFKIGDEVTLNYIDSRNDEYYIRGNITEIDPSSENIIIHNNNPLFFPRHYEFNNGNNYYSMIFLKHGFFEINRIKMSMIKKELF
jgi:hypothetical protein